MYCFGTAINSTELNLTSETKPCDSHATVEPAWHGSGMTFEMGQRWAAKYTVFQRIRNGEKNISLYVEHFRGGSKKIKHHLP